MGITVNLFQNIDNQPSLSVIQGNNNVNIPYKGKLNLLQNAVLDRVSGFGYVEGKFNPADIYKKGFSQSKTLEWSNYKGNKFLEYKFL